MTTVCLAVCIYPFSMVQDEQRRQFASASVFILILWCRMSRTTGLRAHMTIGSQRWRGVVLSQRDSPTSQMALSSVGLYSISLVGLYSIMSLVGLIHYYNILGLIQQYVIGRTYRVLCHRQEYTVLCHQQEYTVLCHQ